MSKLQMQLLVFSMGALIVQTSILAQNFTNIAPPQSILNFAGGSFGSGVSFYDWNKDGYDDITLLEENSKPKFYLNQQGDYIPNVFLGLDVSANYKSVNWVDFDNDGDPDISFNSEGSPFKLYLNNGDFTFSDISSSSGIIQVSTKGYGTSWGDYNKDGFLDVYLSTYMDSSQVDAQANFLFKNNGDGTFENTTDIAGLSIGGQLTFESVWFDYDNDSWPDLFVANDRAFRNNMYHNNGDGTFSEVGDEAGVSQVFDAMSVTVGDYDNDGWFDMYITNTPLLGNYLYHNNGDGTFSIISGSTSPQMFQYSWGAIWLDGDNDQWQDLFVATIDYELNNFPGFDSYFKNTGSSFEPLYTTGLNNIANLSYAAARGDINNDGYPDILVHNTSPIGTQVWQNDGGSANYLKVQLKGVVSNRDGVGCLIELSAGGTHQHRYTMNGEQYLSQNSQWQFFGLSSHELVDSITVIWPSKWRDVFYNLPVNEALTIEEGSSLVNQIQAIGSSTICEGDSLVLDAGEWEAYLWSNGSTDRYITVYQSGTYSVDVTVGGFSVLTPPILIEINPLPSITIETFDPPCYGESIGYINIVNNGTNDVEQVVWSDSTFGTQRVDLAAGEYAFMFTDTVGCSISQTVFLNQPDSIMFHAEFNQTICPNSWSGFIAVEGGTVPYQYHWDFFYDGEITPFLSIEDEEFSCLPSQVTIHANYQITDAQGCYKIGFQDLQGLVGLDDFEVDKEVIFPNPVQQLLNLNLEVAIQKLDLLDVSGRLIQSYSLTNSNVQQVDVSSLARGFYLISFMQDNATVFKRFIKD